MAVHMRQNNLIKPLCHATRINCARHCTRLGMKRWSAHGGWGERENINWSVWRATMWYIWGPMMDSGICGFPRLCWDVRGWESCSHINFRRWGSQRNLRDCHIQTSILQTREMHSEIGPRSFHLWVWWLLKNRGETWMKWKRMMWQLFWKSNTWRYCTC